MRILSKFWVLLWKNLLLKWRHWFMTILEVVLPVFLFALLAVLRLVSIPDGFNKSDAGPSSVTLGSVTAPRGAEGRSSSVRSTWSRVLTSWTTSSVVTGPKFSTQIRWNSTRRPAR